jgi:hypothetical protein
MPNPILDQDRAAFLNARNVIGKVLVPAWPRSEKELDAVEVEVGWLRFSTLNHRTKAEQMREISKTGRADLFSADPLGVEAQAAQYRILMGQEGFGALKADLQERGQQDPAIITAEGVLINGNRRTAAMRSLYIDDNFLKAQYVKCLVLPQDATIEELVNLEAELQVARDFKQDYSWINEALLIEELYVREGRDFERVATRMHRAEGDVRALYEKLQQVNQLVSLSNGAKLHIDFEDNESAFDELNKHIRNKPPAEADSVRSIYFLGTLADVKYRKLRHLRRADAAELVRREIEGDAALRPIIDMIEGPAQEIRSDDPLDDVLGAPPPTTGVNTILGFVAARRPEEMITVAGAPTVSVQEVLESLQSAIVAAADEAEEEQRDQTAATAPLVRADKAIVELERVLAALPRARTFPDWAENTFAAKVADVETLIGRIRTSR